MVREEVVAIRIALAGLALAAGVHAQFEAEVVVRGSRGQHAAVVEQGLPMIAPTRSGRVAAVLRQMVEVDEEFEPGDLAIWFRDADGGWDEEPCPLPGVVRAAVVPSLGGESEVRVVWEEADRTGVVVKVRRLDTLSAAWAGEAESVIRTERSPDATASAPLLHGAGALGDGRLALLSLQRAEDGRVRSAVHIRDATRPTWTAAGDPLLGSTAQAAGVNVVAASLSARGSLVSVVCALGTEPSRLWSATVRIPPLPAKQAAWTVVPVLHEGTMLTTTAPSSLRLLQTARGHRYMVVSAAGGSPGGDEVSLFYSEAPDYAAWRRLRTVDAVAATADAPGYALTGISPTAVAFVVNRPAGELRHASAWTFRFGAPMDEYAELLAGLANPGFARQVAASPNSFDASGKVDGGLVLVGSGPPKRGGRRVRAAYVAPAGAFAEPGSRFAGRGQPRPRSDAAWQDAIDEGLRWLIAHQSPDGRWSGAAFMKLDTEGEPCDGAGREFFDVGLTGLAVLAFCSDGHTHERGEHVATIELARQWLLTQLVHDGRGDPQQITAAFSTSYIYDYAIACYALAELAAMEDDGPLMRDMQPAIAYLEHHRNPYMVWRYEPRNGDNDSSATSWALLALDAFKAAGGEVDARSFGLAETWYDHMTDPTSGRTGYYDRGGQSGRNAGDHGARFPTEKGEAMTAAALFVRQLAFDRTPDTQGVISRQLELLEKKPPYWDPDGGSIDLYYWQFGSRAVALGGGRQWKTWRRAIEKALLPSQRQDGNFLGSWDPIGCWGEDGGRVYSTAAALLCLTADQAYRLDPDRSR